MKHRILIAFALGVCAWSNVAAQADETAYIIQVAAVPNPDYDDFKKIHKIGYLYEEHTQKNMSQVLMGTYATATTANQKLAQIKAQGYKDAFLKKIAIDDKDAVYIIQLATVELSDDIYWRDWQRLAGNNLYVQLSEQKIRLAVGAYRTEDEAEAAYKKLQPTAPKDMFIKRVSSKILHRVTPFEMARSSAEAQNAAVARASVRTLQTLLTKEGIYRDKADGVWGKSTAAALAQYQQTSERYKNYATLAEKATFGTTIEPYSLQYYLNLVATKPFTADEGLKQFKHPLAKVYRAYMYLNGDVQTPNTQATIDELMNEACKMVFTGYKQKTRSDFSMAYSYKDVSQLIKHLRELHEAVKDEPQVPCWLFDRHAAVATEAFAPYWNNDRDKYTISTDCGSFFDIEELKVLLTIAKDFASDGQAAKMTANEAKLNNLYAQPIALTSAEAAALRAWNVKLWTGLNTWATGSAFQQNMYGVLHLAYTDAVRVLEDHFLKHGFVLEDAHTLTLQVLQWTVGCSLDEYCGK